MIFNTSWFLLFFCLVFLASFFFHQGRGRLYMMLLCSAVFYFHFAGPGGVLPIAVTALGVYFLGMRLEAAPPGSRKKWLAAGLAVPIAVLCAYKYRVFLLENLLFFRPEALERLGFLARKSELPLGISFFTFEFIHYLVEVYRGNPAVRRPSHFALFAFYFPSLVAGPIKRYQPFLAQADTAHIKSAPADLALEGAAQALLGFFKKLVVADQAVIAIGFLEAQPDPGAPAVLLLIALQSVRILFDFSGYSDIAIGLSKMLGIRLPTNFNFPYLALNPSDFWRRWHMSLSSWIREYLYIPLGGNRLGPFRKSVNLFVTMGLCGLWHGASWNFALWGLYHGAGLAAHSLFRKWRPLQAKPAWYASGAAWLANLVFVCFGWLVFFYPLDKVAYYTKILLNF